MGSPPWFGQLEGLGLFVLQRGVIGRGVQSFSLAGALVSLEQRISEQQMGMEADERTFFL